MISSVMYILLMFAQALQAPACHENMVKVGGYILGEFGNLIAGDPRSGYASAYCFFSCYECTIILMMIIQLFQGTTTRRAMCIDICRYVHR